MITLNKDYILKSWTRKLHENVEEQKLLLLFELGEAVCDFLASCTITNAYKANDDNYGEIFCVQLDSNKERLTYFLVDSTGDRGHIFSSPVTSGIVNPKISTVLLPFLDTLKLGRLERHLKGFYDSSNAFTEAFNYFNHPLTDIHYTYTYDNGTFEIAVYDKAFLLVPKIQLEEIAKRKVSRDFGLIDLNEHPGDDSPVSWLSELTGVSDEEILKLYQNTSPDGEEARISEDDAYHFVEEYFGEEKYFQKELKEKGYKGIFGKPQFEEIPLNEFIIYRTR